MNYKEITDWLLDGDVSIQYQVFRDLLDAEKPGLQKRIAVEGWGAQIMAFRNDNGHWGREFYQPKWTSTHYTLLDLKNLCIQPDYQPIRETSKIILDTQKGSDGGINPAKTVTQSDVCVCGMALNYLSYFKSPQKQLQSIVDFIISQQLPDGGFNCRYNISGASHSSLHSTISVLEGITEYEKNGYQYRKNELSTIAAESTEFILMHRLFKSDRTGEVIHKNFLHFPYPPRWKYDILRALDYFQYAGIQYDDRMDDAVQVLLRKRRRDNRWNQQAKHPGKIHFEMEKAGKPGRWNTLRALRVFKNLNINID